MIVCNYVNKKKKRKRYLMGEKHGSEKTGDEKEETK